MPSIRSVVGTIDIAADDQRLERADREVRDLFAASRSPFPGISDARSGHGCFPSRTFV
jgi:hypothetical protein